MYKIIFLIISILLNSCSNKNIDISENNKKICEINNYNGVYNLRLNKDFNDDAGEHDFGSFEFCGETIFWKIEYYDLDFQMHSLDPSDPNITARVLTILLGHEY